MLDVLNISLGGDWHPMSTLILANWVVSLVILASLFQQINALLGVTLTIDLVVGLNLLFTVNDVVISA